MPITERTLKKWRKEALLINEAMDREPTHPVSPPLAKALLERVVRMTQELLDQHLIRKG